MSTDPTIVCPHCSKEIKLTESLAAPLIKTVQKEYEAIITEKETEVSKREDEIRVQQREVKRAQNAINEQVAEKLKIERAAISEEEALKAKRATASDLEAKTKELEELEEVLKQRDRKLEEAQKAQADTLRKQRELDEAKRELDLTVEKRVRDSVEEVRQSTKQEVEEELKLTVTEKEEQISSMKRQIEELQKKAEQGSQQLQGEVLELEVEARLNTKFPLDCIEPVPKGESGADVLQKVVSPMGQACGHILWETKRTKNWNDEWLTKLRNDQRAAKAEIAVIVSTALPKDVETFGERDDVWITQPLFAMPLAICLRQSLIAMANIRQAQVGQETKMEMVYRYLTGPEFKHRVEAIVEKFSNMQEDLDRERKTMTRLWAKREKQIEGVIESTAGMYGDLQGIAGRELQEIESLDIPLLESGVLDNNEQ
ncbi:MAG: DUF2130 domain-containing protein [Nitrospinae bacterium]|nr:DUF2130 domain-containing protein [Nitrospinota bacterium]